MEMLRRKAPGARACAATVHRRAEKPGKTGVKRGVCRGLGEPRLGEPRRLAEPRAAEAGAVSAIAGIRRRAPSRRFRRLGGVGQALCDLRISAAHPLAARLQPIPNGEANGREGALTDLSDCRTHFMVGAILCDDWW
jgi:hypothetical protein